MNKKKTYHNDQQSTMGKIRRLGKPTKTECAMDRKIENDTHENGEVTCEM